MAKKNRKKNEDLPEGMSRRQAKLAARAAEREALAGDPRPYKGFAAEADLIAMQEFVPAATAALDVNGTPVTLATVLPGASAGLVRSADEGGERLVALQVQSHSGHPARDLAYALNWAVNAQPGETLGSTAADGSQPELSALIDASSPLDITEHTDFNWWFPAGAGMNPQIAQALQRANDAIIPSTKVDADVPGSVWWVNPGGGKAHIRWIRPEDDERALLNALARVAARGELNLGDGTKFAGTFRTHGLLVPVFDLDPSVSADSYGEALAAVNEAIEKEYSNSAQLTADERKQLENIKSRQVTI